MVLFCLFTPWKVFLQVLKIDFLGKIVWLCTSGLLEFKIGACGIFLLENICVGPVSFGRKEHIALAYHTLCVFMILPVHVDFFHLLCVWGGNIVCLCCMVLFLLLPKFCWFQIRYKKLVGIFHMLNVDCWTDRSDYHSMVTDKVCKCEPWLSMPGVVSKPPTCSDSHLRIFLHSFSWSLSCRDFYEMAQSSSITTSMVVL